LWSLPLFATDPLLILIPSGVGNVSPSTFHHRFAEPRVLDIVSWTYFTPLSSCLSRCHDAFEINPIFHFPFLLARALRFPLSRTRPRFNALLLRHFFHLPVFNSHQPPPPLGLDQGHTFKTCVLLTLYFSPISVFLVYLVLLTIEY
jgi:hypothetical protein